MANTINIPKSHLIMGLCLPLAVMLGYLLAEPLDSATLGVVIFVLVILSVPVLMKWHHPLLILSWNAWVNTFFLPGNPGLWMITSFCSLLFGLLNRSVNPDNKFILLPSLVKPLVFLLMVVLATAFLTGGLAIRSMGAENYGGRGYFYIIAAVMGFLAFTSGRIPAKRANLYLAMFFLASFTPLIGILSQTFGSKAVYLSALFATDGLDAKPVVGPIDPITTHFGALSFLGNGLYAYLLARYGLRGVLDFSKPLRGIAFVAAALSCLACGYRGAIIVFAVTVLIMFFVEGLHRTHHLFIGAAATIIAAVCIVSFSTKLPPSVQRTVSFLPLEIDPVVQETATSSTDWRIEIWKLAVPEIPKYLIKGKGYAIDPGDLYMASFGSSVVGAALCGDYHNGLLTLIIPFGIFGVIAFVWFLVASFRYMIHFYRYGDPNLKTINTYLLVAFSVQLLTYLFIFGNFYTDLPHFIGLIGFSVSLNGLPERQAEEPIAADALEPA